MTVLFLGARKTRDSLKMNIRCLGLSSRRSEKEHTDSLLHAGGTEGVREIRPTEPKTTIQRTQARVAAYTASRQPRI